MRWVGAIWVAPAALVVWALYLLPFWGLGLIKPSQRHGFVIEFSVNLKWEWWASLWRGWAGHALPFAIVMQYQDPAVRRHELKHCDQWLLLGVLFPVVYGALLLTHGYRDHPLEVRARAAE